MNPSLARCSRTPTQCCSLPFVSPTLWLWVVTLHVLWGSGSSHQFVANSDLGGRGNKTKSLQVNSVPCLSSLYFPLFYVSREDILSSITNQPAEALAALATCHFVCLSFLPALLSCSPILASLRLHPQIQSTLGICFWEICSCFLQISQSKTLWKHTFLSVFCQNIY